MAKRNLGREKPRGPIEIHDATKTFVVLLELYNIAKSVGYHSSLLNARDYNVHSYVVQIDLCTICLC